ncbi:hypothetical protein [Nocardia asteroides]
MTPIDTAYGARGDDHRVNNDRPHHRLDAITVIDGRTVRLTHPPTDLVFDEK